MNRRLAWFCSSFALTELLAAWLPAPALLPATAFLVCTLVALLVVKHKEKKKLFDNTTLIVFGIACGLIWSTVYRYSIVARVQAIAGETLPCTVTIETDCETSYQEGMLRGTLHVTEVDGAKTDFRVYCSAFPGMEAGERFTGQLTFEIPENDSYRLGRYAKGIYLVAEYQSSYHQLEGSQALRFTMLCLRKELSRRLGTYLPRELAGLESAMLLADKSHLRDDVTATFRTAGVSHLLSVSGLHVALLCGLFTLGLGTGNRKRFAVGPIVLQATMLVAYMLLTGLPISVIRAGTIYLIALLGYAMLQPPDLLTSLGVAALFLSLQNAYAPCDVGFQLSFCGVLGVQLAGEIERLEKKNVTLLKNAVRPVPTEETGEHITPKLLFQYARYFFIQIGFTVQCAALATLATMPVLLAHGLTTSGVAILTNVLVVWMLRYVLILGIIVLLLSALPAPMFMHMASLLLGIFLRVMYAIVAWCAALPFAHVVLPRNYTLFVLLGLMILAAVFYRYKMLQWYLPISCAVTITSVVLGIALSRDVVTVALVGSAGNPCLVIMQNQTAAVVFRGGAKNCEYINEYLSQNNIGQISTLIDIRQKPTETLPDAASIIVPESLGDNVESIPLFPEIEVDVYHNSKGNLVAIDVAGYSIATMAGYPIGKGEIIVDAFCVAGAYPMGLQANDILYTARNPDWLKNLMQDTTLHYGENPVFVIRPGKSYVIKEATENALQ